MLTLRRLLGAWMYLPINPAKPCWDSPNNWIGMGPVWIGIPSCANYNILQLCTASGKYGIGWLPSDGTFADYAVAGRDATQACCACGGGSASPPIITKSPVRVALEALYNATGGENWTDSPGNGWLKGACHCRWAGLICVDGATCPDSPVVALGWNSEAGNNLVGTLPLWNGDPEQGALPHLQELQLPGNPGLTGQLPEVWGKMTNIEIMVLNNNNFVGSLPAAWGKMTKMTDFRLSKNSLEGDLPESYGNMTQLGVLYFNNNYLNLNAGFGVVPKLWWEKMGTMARGGKKMSLRLYPQLNGVSCADSITPGARTSFPERSI